MSPTQPVFWIGLATLLACWTKIAKLAALELEARLQGQHFAHRHRKALRNGNPALLLGDDFELSLSTVSGVS